MRTDVKVGIVAGLTIIGLVATYLCLYNQDNKEKVSRKATEIMKVYDVNEDGRLGKSEVEAMVRANLDFVHRDFDLTHEDAARPLSDFSDLEYAGAEKKE